MPPQPGLFQVTLDESRISEMDKLPEFRELKRYELDGEIEIFDPRTTDRSGKVERRPAPWEKRGSTTQIFQQIAAVLFPQRDPKRLSMQEINCVAHLVQHHRSGRDIFVTTNASDFVANGKRERLKTTLKILVLTPAEAVEAIVERRASAK